MITAYLLLACFGAIIVGISISAVVQSEREQLPTARYWRRRYKAQRLDLSRMRGRN